MPFGGKIGVIGAGAMGGFYGARLARAGNDVHFLLRRDYDIVRERGLLIRSYQGDFQIKPPVHKTAREMGLCDFVIVGLKTTDNAAFAELLGPTVGPDTVVLTLQNGLGNEDEIVRVLARQADRWTQSQSPESTRKRVSAMVLAAERVMGGVAFVCCNRIDRGVIHHSDHGWLRLAEYSGPPHERTNFVASLFREAGFEVEVHDSLARVRWMKLVWNVPFNGLGVTAGHATSRHVLEDDELMRVARALMEEVVAAARADGVKDIDPRFVDHMIAATETMGYYKSSMQMDYEAGRPLEVESILGEPVRRARRAGIDVPRMQMLYALARRLDQLNRGSTTTVTQP